MNGFINKIAPNGFAMLDKVDAQLNQWASNLKLDNMIFYIAGIVLALLIGVLGYRLIKVLLAASFAYVGYLAGVELFGFLGTYAPNMPAWLSYVFGGVCAVLLFAAAFLRFSYALYTLLAMVGYHLLTVYVPDHRFIAIAGGLLLALLAVYFVRLSFVILTSYAGALFTVGFLGKLLPNLAFLQLGTSQIAFFIVLGLILVFVLLQLLTTRKLKKA